MNDKKNLILGIESASQHFSVALYKEGEILGSAEVSKIFAASEECATLVSELFNSSNKAFSELSHIVVNNGPGSFTGLRVAHSFAKGLAAFDNLPIIGLNAFDLLFNNSESNIALIESKRDEVYFSRRNAEISLIKKADLSDLIQKNETILCNRIKDLSNYLPKNKFLEKISQAESLCKTAALLIKEKQTLPRAEILYFHNFAKKS